MAFLGGGGGRALFKSEAGPQENLHRHNKNDVSFHISAARTLWSLYGFSTVHSFGKAALEYGIFSTHLMFTLAG